MRTRTLFLRRFSAAAVLSVLAAAAPMALAHTLQRPVPSSPDADRPEGYARVVDALRAWSLGEAERMLAELRRKSPDRPEWDGLEGAIAYLQGRYSQAVERLNAALKKRPGDSEWLELRLHVRQSESAVQGFKVHRTPHFEILYDPAEDAILIPYLEEVLESAYQVLGKELGMKPAETVRVEVFSDPDRFHRASTLSRRDIEEKGAVGISKFNKFMIISPGALLRGYRWLDTAAHEFVHYLIVRRTRNRTPIWLHEGLAHYLEKRWRAEKSSPLHPSEEALLARARETDTFVSFKRMEPSLVYLDTPEEVQLAYAEAASAVDFIQRRGGDGALARLLGFIGEAGVPSPKAKAAGEAAAQPARRRSSLVELESTGPPQSAEPGLRALFGVDLAGFEKIWREDLSRQRLRPHPGAQVRKFELKPKGPLDERSIDLAALKSAVARRRMRLGDRLSFHGRLQAALIEYRRAIRDEPYSTALLNRAARLEIRLGLLDAAQRNLRKAERVDPDYPTTFVNLAVSLEMAGDERGARRAWEEVIQINPFIPTAHERLAVLYERAGDAGRAAREKRIFRQLRGRQ